MTYPIEEEAPCIHHRSAFDTIPAPPSFEARPWDVATENNLATYGIRSFVPPARYPSEPTMVSTVAHVLPADAPIHLTRAGREKLAAAGVDLSKPVTLTFDGGEVELPKPTRADLVLSAQQWVTAMREDMTDRWCETAMTGVRECMLSRINRLDAILKELADAEK